MSLPRMEVVNWSPHDPIGQSMPRRPTWRMSNNHWRLELMDYKSYKLLATGLATAVALIAAPAAHAGKTVDAIKARGQLVCGVNTGLAGFSAADSQGKWSGLDVDVCRAIAAAMLGDANKVKWVPLNAQ